MTLHLEASRTVPVPVADAYATVLTAPLTAIFARRFAAIAPITGVTDQQGEWGSPGQERTIVLGDGGRLREVLTSVDAPDSFGYRVTVTRGPNRFIIGEAAGRWTFAPAGTGTRVTWAWDITPANRAAVALLPVFARMWRGYARQALEEIENLLVTRP